MMSPLELFRTLVAFAPERRDLSQAPWRPSCLGPSRRVAPIAAFNLEYRLGAWWCSGVGPGPVALGLSGDRQRQRDEAGAAQALVEPARGTAFGPLAGAVNFVETLYPHGGFRPLSEVRVGLDPRAFDGFGNYLRQSGFQPTGSFEDAAGAHRMLSDDRMVLLLHGALTEVPTLDAQLVERLVPVKVLGPSVWRPALEDAVLLHCAMLGRAGFEAPAIEWVDLRELLLGAPFMGHSYSRPLEVAALASRVMEGDLAPTVSMALITVAALFPETAAVAAAIRALLPPFTPSLGEATLLAQLSTLGSCAPQPDAAPALEVAR